MIETLDSFLEKNKKINAQILIILSGILIYGKPKDFDINSIVLSEVWIYNEKYAGDIIIPRKNIDAWGNAQKQSY